MLPAEVVRPADRLFSSVEQLHTYARSNAQETSHQQRLLASNKAIPVTSDVVNVSNSRQARPRLHFLSNLRVFLTALVVFHHTAIPYGGLGSFGFQSRCFPSISPVLAIFNAMNQTFFMALFFWMAGFFTHRELRVLAEKERSIRPLTKNEQLGVHLSLRAGFVCGRAKRLLIPTMVYTVVLEPAKVVMLGLHFNIQGTSAQKIAALPLIKLTLKDYFLNLSGIRGPVWFSALVWIFDAVATILISLLPHLTARYPSLSRILTQPRSWGHAQRIRCLCLALSIITAFLIRIPYPAGTILPLLNLQVGFVPQYIFAYTAGHVSASTGNLYCYAFMADVKHHPIRRLILNTLKMLFCLFYVGISAMLEASVSKSGNEDSGWEERTIIKLVGGWNYAAFLYAICNEMGFISIGANLVAVFEKYFNQPWKLEIPIVQEKNLARYCYATFLVHVPVSLGMELVVERAMGNGCDFTDVVGCVSMTAVVGTVNVVMSWAVAVVVCEKTCLGWWA